ncbi:MAG: phospho-N-acetylmuramoyl-pentapeptide-transferase, partial [Candidatus Kapaibacteriota bacterium]
MLYFLTRWIDLTFDTPGFGAFQYITTRMALAAITALLISFVFGPKIIKLIKRKQIGEQAKVELQSVGLHVSKAGTPTMGGLIVLASLLIPTLLWANLSNMFIIVILITTAFMGLVGFLDDYLKVIKKLPKGLIGRYKIVGQVSIGLFVASMIYFFPEAFSDNYYKIKTKTTIPFLKNVQF